MKTDDTIRFCIGLYYEIWKFEQRKKKAGDLENGNIKRDN
jgi:hypothetical protein